VLFNMHKRNCNLVGDYLQTKTIESIQKLLATVAQYNKT